MLLLDGFSLSKLCWYRILYRFVWFVFSRWCLWIVYKLFIYGILKRFLIFICCYLVYLFYENFILKVSFVLFIFLILGWRKNFECNFRMEELNRFLNFLNVVFFVYRFLIRCSFRLRVSFKWGSIFFLFEWYIFVFFCVETFVCFGLYLFMWRGE